MSAEASRWQAQVPPWVAFPDFPASGLPPTQGAEEQWFDQEWRPFWTALGREEQQDYLDHWKADAEWREALTVFSMLFDGDAAEDLRESEELAEERSRSRASKPSFWSRLKGK